MYTTDFSTAENPLSEGGNWIDGQSVGLDWQNVSTRPGFATFAAPNPEGYDDATAILTGTWAADQYVRVVVRVPQVDPNITQEVEIRLRSFLAAHVNKGYEVLGCAQIVRWNGALGDFTVLDAQYPQGYSLLVSDGDVLSAQMVGDTIRVFLNGIECLNVQDSTFVSGNPGIGFFSREQPSYYTNHPPYGFSRFTASESPIP